MAIPSWLVWVIIVVIIIALLVGGSCTLGDFRAGT